MSALGQMVSFSPALHSSEVEVWMVDGELTPLPNQTTDIRKVTLSLDEAQSLYEELGGVLTAQANTPDFEPADAREEELDMRSEVA